MQNAWFENPEFISDLRFALPSYIKPWTTETFGDFFLAKEDFLFFPEYRKGWHSVFANLVIFRE